MTTFVLVHGAFHGAWCWFKLLPELEKRQQRTVAIDLPGAGDDPTPVATVTLADEDTDEEKVYRIVGDMEADVKDGKISISSPIARALIGKKVGDSIEVAAPGGARGYEILDITFQ